MYKPSAINAILHVYNTNLCQCLFIQSLIVRFSFFQRGQQRIVSVMAILLYVETDHWGRQCSVVMESGIVIHQNSVLLTVDIGYASCLFSLNKIIFSMFQTFITVQRINLDTCTTYAIKMSQGFVLSHDIFSKCELFSVEYYFCVAFSLRI